MQEMNVSYKQLKELPKESYQLLDMRDESNTAYGMIPGAMAVAEDELFSKAKEVIDEKKKPII